MTSVPSDVDAQARRRAALTLGVSNGACYAALDQALAQAAVQGGTVVDLGCGRGGLWEVLGPRFDRYIGVDLVRHEGFPAALEWHQHDLQQPGVPVADASCDVAITCETIPCVENPRLLVRELARIVRPGGWVAVSCPNVEALFSLLMLAARRQHRKFQDEAADFMITPLLAVDLRRALEAAGMVDVRAYYTLLGKVPFLNRFYPRWLAARFPRALSDNFGMLARRPA